MEAAAACALQEEADSAPVVNRLTNGQLYRVRRVNAATNDTAGECIRCRRVRHFLNSDGHLAVEDLWIFVKHLLSKCFFLADKAVWLTPVD
jgi:hypothetical protein